MLSTRYCKPRSLKESTRHGFYRKRFPKAKPPVPQTEETETLIYGKFKEGLQHATDNQQSVRRQGPRTQRARASWSKHEPPRRLPPAGERTPPNLVLSLEARTVEMTFASHAKIQDCRSKHEPPRRLPPAAGGRIPPNSALSLEA